MMGPVARLSCAAHDGGFPSPLSTPFYLMVVYAHMAPFLSRKYICWKQCIIFVVGGKHVKYRYNIVKPEVFMLLECPSVRRSRIYAQADNGGAPRIISPPLPPFPPCLCLSNYGLLVKLEVPIINGFPTTSPTCLRVFGGGRHDE